MSLTADRRLWLTADESAVVEDGDERSAFLLAGEGAVIADDLAAKYLLTEKDGKIVLPKATSEAEGVSNVEGKSDSGSGVDTSPDGHGGTDTDAGNSRTRMR